MSTIGIITLIIGICVTLFTLIFGIIRICDTPKGYNFSDSAEIRWTILTIAGAIGGIALIVISFLI